MAPNSSSPLKFFILTFVLSTPFLLVGAFTGIQVMEGIPISALMAVCPVSAAVILTRCERGSVRGLLERTFDFQRIRRKIWYIPILLLMPAILLLSYLWMRLAGSPLPAPQFSIFADTAMSAAFFGGAIVEELGWTAYVLEPLQERSSALKAALLIGTVWAIWHIVPFAQAHRSTNWIAWQCFNTVALRVLMVWIYNNSGKSVFAAILFHTTINASDFLFPNNGSHFSPRVAGLITAGTAALVTAIRRPKTIAESHCK